ncbi:16837_t:CDS:2 [Funneliformis caledonium]|uniref:16837_t:CDS:1 n=1 Tax=Funneliformis caledonium TaxID=1117310 RepID=A0A9N9CJ38_9GLOM|nr:16837_t:CDS:2 [Funneliformis caledonium]
MEQNTLSFIGSSNGYNNALYDTFYSDTFDLSPESEPLPFNSNVNDIQHFEPFNDIPDSDIPNSELPYQYYLVVEQGIDYQIFRNDKDLKDHTIICRKSIRCLSSGLYKARNTTNQVKCTSLIGIHNHETNSAQVLGVFARYKRFSKEMIQDLNFLWTAK